MLSGYVLSTLRYPDWFQPHHILGPMEAFEKESTRGAWLDFLRIMMKMCLRVYGKGRTIDVFLDDDGEGPEEGIFECG